MPFHTFPSRSPRRIQIWSIPAQLASLQLSYCTICFLSLLPINHRTTISTTSGKLTSLISCRYLFSRLTHRMS
jgi:hypothetical protein